MEILKYFFTKKRKISKFWQISDPEHYDIPFLSSSFSNEGIKKCKCNEFFSFPVDTFGLVIHICIYNYVLVSLENFRCIVIWIKYLIAWWVLVSDEFRMPINFSFNFSFSLTYFCCCNGVSVIAVSLRWKMVGCWLATYVLRPNIHFSRKLRSYTKELAERII